MSPRRSPRRHPNEPPSRSRCSPRMRRARSSPRRPREPLASPDHRRHRCRRGWNRSPPSAPPSISDSVSVAILVADHETGEILASVGSSGLFDERRDGFIDMTRAVRSPGSIAEAADLRPRLRARPRASGDADRGQAGRFRRLPAGELRPHIPRHRDAAPRAAAFAERAGDRASRSRRSGAARGAHAPRRGEPAAPRHLAAGPRRRPRRRRRHADRSRRDRRGDRARRPRGAADARSGRIRRLADVPAKVLDERAAWYVASILAGAPGPDHVSPGSHRLQDRHLLRLSRRLGGRLRRQARDRRLGRPAGRRAGARPDRHRRGGADPDGRLRPARTDDAAPRRAAGHRRSDRREPARAAPPLPLAERADRRRGSRRRSPIRRAACASISASATAIRCRWS